MVNGSVDNNERLRGEVATELAPVLLRPLDHNHALLWAVAGDVLSAWYARTPDQPVRLVGPHGFTSDYVGKVSYQREDVDGGQYWPQFLPPGCQPGDRFDLDDYERRVWQHHAARITRRRYTHG